MSRVLQDVQATRAPPAPPQHPHRRTPTPLRSVRSFIPSLRRPQASCPNLRRRIHRFCQPPPCLRPLRPPEKGVQLGPALHQLRATVRRVRLLSPSDVIATPISSTTDKSSCSRTATDNAISSCSNSRPCQHRYAESAKWNYCQHSQHPQPSGPD